MTMEELCRELHNWFDVSRAFGHFVIVDGEIRIPKGVLQDGAEDWLWNPFNFEDDVLTVRGQYYRIVGSVFNDGVYHNPPDGLIDEVFDGAIWAMAVPRDVVQLLDKINDWESKYGAVAASPYTSESFGGYSYSKATGASGGGVSWREAFADDLKRWRKI